jgi:UDP-N-acetylglucosamine 2-epimerase
VGTSEEAIYREARVLLVDAEARRRMSLPVSPYGDGHAAERIASALTGECYPPLEPV